MPAPVSRSALGSPAATPATTTTASTTRTKAAITRVTSADRSIPSASTAVTATTAATAATRSWPGAAYAANTPAPTMAPSPMTTASPTPSRRARVVVTRATVVTARPGRAQGWGVGRPRVTDDASDEPLPAGGGAPGPRESTRTTCVGSAGRAAGAGTGGAKNVP